MIIIFRLRVFVQNYLEFLELKPNDFMPRWRGDFYTEFNHFDEKTENFYKPKKKKILNFSISLNNLLYGIAGTVVISFLIFFGYKYNETLSSPQLDITKPQTNDVVESDLIDVFGKTDSDAILKINNEKITIGTDGNFSTSLKLSEGINTFKFTASNPFGKETVRILHIIYRPRKVAIYTPPIESLIDGKTEPEKKIITKPSESVNLSQPVKSLTLPAKVVTTSPSSKTNSKQN